MKSENGGIPPHTGVLKNILHARFRANPAYELVVFDRLPEEHRLALRELQQDPDFYGVLWPRQTQSLAVKAVDQDTALLFLTLQEPGPLPTYVQGRLGTNCNRVMAEFVLDGILEMHSDQSGDFVSGAQAHSLVYEEGSPAQSPRRVARLSREALQYAQALNVDSLGQLSLRLYLYNTIPVSPTWRQRLPSEEAVASYLGIQAGGRNRSLLDGSWTFVTAPDAGEGWWMWRIRHTSQDPGQTSRLGYKLYISPTPAALPDAWGAILEVFAALKIPSFKVGKDVYGLLRPDKIVAYFAELDDLAALATRLEKELAGCEAQGVPFTAGIDADGLLSWGMDPPRDAQLLGWQARESWRLWVTNRLAAALLTARATPSSLAPWRFALERLRLEGIDPETWTPRQMIWQQIRRS